MAERRILITGGAGFVGSNVAAALQERHPTWEVVAADNLRRRGSELNLGRLADRGVAFAHVDVRNLDDLLSLDSVDAIVECSAEPSTLAGLTGSVAYPVETNLVGAFHCLELARRDGAHVVFLSTSRVYPVDALEAVSYRETETRFELDEHQDLPGVTAEGVAEDFGGEGSRTIYGATKLAAELLVTEYRAAFGIPTTVNRCGVIAGPWQMGKTEQGVFSYWLLAHHFGRELSYLGYGGTGKQVRDLMHVDDLVELLDEQLGAPDEWDGWLGNVGGGRASSLSLLEATEICRELTGRSVTIRTNEPARPGDVPIFVSDTSRLRQKTAWAPTRGPERILGDIAEWVRGDEHTIRRALGF